MQQPTDKQSREIIQSFLSINREGRTVKTDDIGQLAMLHSMAKDGLVRPQCLSGIHHTQWYLTNDAFAFMEMTAHLDGPPTLKPVS